MYISDARVVSNSFKKNVMHDRLKFYIKPIQHNLQTFANEVKKGLTNKKKFLLPQYFYDESGSELFEQISEQPEYYLTRTEASILASFAGEIADMCDKAVLVELGSGSSKKPESYLMLCWQSRIRCDIFP